MDKQKLWLKLHRIARDLRMISHSIHGDHDLVEDHIKKAQDELQHALDCLKVEIEG